MFYSPVSVPFPLLIALPESAIEGVTPLGPSDTEGGFTTPAVEDSTATGDDTEAEVKSPTPAVEETDAEGVYVACDQTLIGLSRCL